MLAINSKATDPSDAKISKLFYKAPYMLLKQIKEACSLYADGFASMTLGRTLWKVVAIKLFVLFALIWPFLHTGPKTVEAKEALAVSKLLDK